MTFLLLPVSTLAYPLADSLGLSFVQSVVYYLIGIYEIVFHYLEESSIMQLLVVGILFSALFL